MTASEPAIKYMPGMLVISKRGRGPVPQIFITLIEDIFGQIIQRSNPKGKSIIAGYPMTIYHDPPDAIDPNAVDTEIAVPIRGEIKVDPGFEIKTMPVHRVVSIMHKGPYSECERSFAIAMGFIGKKGLTVAGPFREIYMNSPEDVPESELLTEIQIPIA